MRIRTFAPVVFLALLAFSVQAHAQGTPAPERSPMKMHLDSLHHVPGRSMMNRGAMMKSYADSTDFNAAFETTYQLLKPKESMKARAAHQFALLYPRYKNRGVDSLSAWKAIAKSLDTTHDRQVLFQTYRTIFNAEELRSYNAFIKTAAGKKMYDAQMRLVATSNEMQGYVSRMVMSTIMPMAKAGDPPAPHHAPMPPAVTNPPTDATTH